MITNRRCALAICIGLLTAAAVTAQAPSFTPDGVFQGSTLAGWHTVGNAGWRAANGVVTGDGESHGAGWLMLDHSYQDTGLYAQFRCQGDCDTGVLLRAHKTDKGTEGVFVAIKADELAAYRLTLDANGREIERKKLRLAGGQIRFAPV